MHREKEREREGYNEQEKERERENEREGSTQFGRVSINGQSYRGRVWFTLELN